MQAVEEYMKKLAVAEKAKESNIDIVAGYTGEMLGQIFQWKQDEWSKDLRAWAFIWASLSIFWMPMRI